MMNRPILLLLTVFVCPGCTTLALKTHVLKQEASPTDIRFQETIDDLALVASNPSALPAYSSIFAGTAQITDTAQLAATTTFVPGAASQVITPQFTRIELGNWSLDPINAPEKLEALRGACQWVIYGPEFASTHDAARLLASPEQAPFPGRHFGVADRLAKLPQGFLHISAQHHAPREAILRSCSGNTNVWVMPNDMKYFADFSLILQDIARIDINSMTLLFIRPASSDFLFPTSAPDGAPCCSGPLTNLPRRVVAQVSVDACGNLTSDTNYYRWRTDNVGSDAALRSQINAAGLH